MRNLNPFNEKIYTGKNTILKREASIFFQDIQNTFSESKAKEKEENKEVIKLYNDFLLQIKDFIDFLKIGKSDLEKALIVTYLLDNDYLSNNFLINLPLKYNDGVNVIENEKTPFSVSNFYRDLFKDKQYPLLYPCLKTDKPDSFKAKHAREDYQINLAMHEGNLYGIDLLTKNIYTFRDAFTMEIISNYLEEYLRYKPYLEMLTHLGYTISDVQENLELFQNSVCDGCLTLAETNMLKDRINYLLWNKIHILNSFKEDKKELKEEIHKMLLKKR